MDGLKYEYWLRTWGGFYNKQFKEQHREAEGFHYFESAEERSEYLEKLKKIEKELNVFRLAFDEGEGYCTRTITTIHRVIKYEGKAYYSKREFSPNYPYEAAKLHLENQWYPGFNDYPLGEDFDYGANGFEIVQEWITGAFSVTDE